MIIEVALRPPQADRTVAILLWESGLGKSLAVLSICKVTPAASPVVFWPKTVADRI